MRDLDQKFAAKNGVKNYRDLIDNLCVDVEVLDGDKIQCGEMTFTVVELPGHTKCSVGFYLEENELLHCASFSFEETKSILQTAYKVCGQDCEITLDTIDKIYWNKMNDKSTQYSDMSLYDDFKDFSRFTECAMKICVQTDDAQKAKLISQSVPACDYLPFSDIPWYKFSSSTATKEHSIKVLSEKIQIPLEQTIAFGDDFNDIGMLKLCGTGVAMKNAIPQVKEVADYETLSNNEDGVAKYIEENIL